MKVFILLPIFLMSFAFANSNVLNYTYGNKTKKLDTNKYKTTSNGCREESVSGVLEIKNKNLDYDKNGVYHKHQRITYVIPDKKSKKVKNCKKERATGINEINFKKMVKKLD